MRFYAQGLLARISLPLLNLVLCVFQISSAVRHPSSPHTLLAVGWSLITLLNTLNFWGTYWKVTAYGLLESQLLFMRRVVPYSIIQDVRLNDSAQGEWTGSSIRVSILMDKPLLARPAEYARFVAALGQHVDPVRIHV